MCMKGYIFQYFKQIDNAKISGTLSICIIVYCNLFSLFSGQYYIFKCNPQTLFVHKSGLKKRFPRIPKSKRQLNLYERGKVFRILNKIKMQKNRKLCECTSLTLGISM